MKKSVKMLMNVFFMLVLFIGITISLPVSANAEGNDAKVWKVERDGEEYKPLENSAIGVVPYYSTSYYIPMKSDSIVTMSIDMDEFVPEDATTMHMKFWGERFDINGKSVGYGNFGVNTSFVSSSSDSDHVSYLTVNANELFGSYSKVKITNVSIAYSTPTVGTSAKTGAEFILFFDDDCYNGTHTFDGEGVVKKATCTDKGEGKHYCTKCCKLGGGSYVINATGHSHDDYSAFKIVKPLSGTATGKTYLNYYKCTDCEVEFSEESNTQDTKATWIDKKVTKEATCSTPGEMTAYAMFYGNATYVEETAKNPENHTYDKGIKTEPTYKVAGKIVYTCTGCGTTKKTSIPKLTCSAHKFDNGVVKKAATFTKTGTVVYKCKTCGYTKEAVINKLYLAKPVLLIEPLSAGYKLKWNKVESAGGYYVYRSTDGAKYSKIATIKKGSTTTYTDKKAKKNGAKYRYKIVAYAKEGSKTYLSSDSDFETAVFLAQPKIASLKNSSAKTISAKCTGNTKANGIELQYSTSSNFAKAKTVTVKKNGSTTINVKKLKKGTTYYVRARVYKSEGAVKHVSAWTAAKKIKITK